MTDLLTPTKILPNPVIFAVAGEPRGKGRPRTRVIGKHAQVYTDEKTRAYESAIRGAARAAMGTRKPLTGQLHLEVVAYCGITPSWTKKEKAAALAGETNSVGRFDADNIIKCAGDGMNGVVFEDDTQISSICARKEYSLTPRLCIAIVPMSDGVFVQPNTVQQCRAIIDNLASVGLLPQQAHLMLIDSLCLHEKYLGHQTVT